jgi:hypothetical protein
MAFLLYTVFGLMVTEICQLENIKHCTQAWQMIKTVGEQLKVRDVSLLDMPSEEKAEAKKRLDMREAKKTEERYLILKTSYLKTLLLYVRNGVFVFRS